ncbi:hypothetical protein EDD11_001720 [Mortierella claussenii]|nr:hypothetical protein EDD11_001720 [Mortierella claussenii]
MHTARSAQFAEEKRGFLSRLNPFAKPAAPETSTPQTPAQVAKAAEDLNVEIEDEDEDEMIPSWKSERQTLTSEQLEQSIRSAAAPFIDAAASSSQVSLRKIQLSDPKLKFQILKACVVSTGYEIPNKDIASIHTLNDLFTKLQRLDQEANALPHNPNGHVVAEWFETNKSTLPPNMFFIPYKKSMRVKADDRKTTNKRFL